MNRIICADWSKNAHKRAAFEVLVNRRLVRRVVDDVSTVQRLFDYATLTDDQALVAFDAPSGVPDSFITAVRARGSRTVVDGFVDWLLTASLGDCTNASDWCVDTPFFQVPKGKGALRSFENAARNSGVALRREVEVRTGGKSVFVTGGVPGSVGAAARDIWLGLVDARKATKRFRIWPFEGATEEMTTMDGVVVAEIYPRAAYATALIDAAPRARLRIAKSNADIRKLAIRRLTETRWVERTEAKFENLDRAAENEDDFDAMMTGAALLRCVIEDLPLWDSGLISRSTEGGILATGSIDFSLDERTLK